MLRPRIPWMPYLGHEHQVVARQLAAGLHAAEALGVEVQVYAPIGVEDERPDGVWRAGRSERAWLR